MCYKIFNMEFTLISKISNFIKILTEHTYSLNKNRTTSSNDFRTVGKVTISE